MRTDEKRTACVLLVSFMPPARFACPLSIMKRFGRLGFLDILIYKPKENATIALEFSPNPSLNLSQSSKLERLSERPISIAPLAS